MTLKNDIDETVQALKRYAGIAIGAIITAVVQKIIRDWLK